MTKLGVWVLVFLVVFVLFSFGQETNTNEGFLDRFYQQEESRGGSFWNVIIDILNIILTLFIIVAIVYVALRFIKKATGSPVDDFGVIEIMASKVISQGIAIYIIRIGKEYYVMSSGEKGLSVITKLEDKELINILNVEKSKQASELKEDVIDAFLSIFRKKREGENTISRGDKSDLTESRFDFLKKQRKKLKEWE